MMINRLGLGMFVFRCGAASLVVFTTLITTPRADQSQFAPEQSNVLTATGPSAPLDLARLVKDSDLVVVGRIRDVADNGPAPVQVQVQCQKCGTVHQVSAVLDDDRFLGDTRSAAFNIRYLAR